MKRIFTILLLACCMYACKPIELLEPKGIITSEFNQYRYAYVIPTNSIVGGKITTHYNWGQKLYVVGNTESVNPADIIAGDLMSRGYGILPNINNDLCDKTMVVSFGEIGSRHLRGTLYSQKIIIQIRDATTGVLIASCEIDGLGGNKAGDIFHAIKRALDSIFKNAKTKLNFEIGNPSSDTAPSQEYKQSSDQASQLEVKETTQEHVQKSHMLGWHNSVLDLAYRAALEQLEWMEDKDLANKYRTSINTLIDKVFTNQISKNSIEKKIAYAKNKNNKEEYLILLDIAQEY